MLSGNIQYNYMLDASSGLAEKVPFVIEPDVNADNKRWILQTPYVAYVDATAPDQGAATAEGYRSLKDLIDAIGLTKRATIVCPSTGIGDTTTYTLTTNETVPTNITLKMEQGAIIDGAGTLTINGPFETGLSQCFGLSITIAGLNFVKPEWWGAKGDNITNDYAALQAAITTASTSSSEAIVKLSKNNYYRTETTLSITGDIQIVGSGYYSSGIVAVETDCISVTQLANRRFQLHNLEIGRSVRYTVDSNTDVAIRVNGDTTHRPRGHVYRDVFVDGFGFAYYSDYLWSSQFDNFKVSNGKVGLKIMGLSVNNVVTNSSFSVSGADSRGIHFADSSVASEGWMVDNTLIDGAEIGIEGSSMSYVYVQNCIIDHCTVNGIYSANDATRCCCCWYINNNYIAITGTGGDAAIKMTNSVAVNPDRGNRISNNHIIAYTDEGCNYGIYISGTEAKYNTIAHNVIDYMDVIDIRLNGGYDIVTGNQCLSANSTYSIYDNIANSGSIIKDNRCANDVYREDVTSNVTLSVYGVTKIDSGDGVLALTLPDAQNMGETKLITMAGAGNNAVVTVTHHNGGDGGTYTFDAVDEAVLLIWTNTEWAEVVTSGGIAAYTP